MEGLDSPLVTDEADLCIGFYDAYAHTHMHALIHNIYVRFTKLLLETLREFDEDQNTTV